MPSLFISCVSNEFANYRDALRKDFTRPNLDTKIQEDFIAYGGATLEKLDEYIQHCETVIHICGDMTGSMANPLSLQYIKNKYKDFAVRIPQLQPVLEGSEELSYTQWEAYLAVYHSKRLFIVAPSATAARDSRYIKDDIQIVHQRKHLSSLKALGYYAEINFDNEDQLVKQLYQSKLGDVLNAIPRIKPVNLPYHSIGNVFKGRKEFTDEIHNELIGRLTDGISAFAIHGLGGMGKTRLAVEYAWQYKNNYTALLFVNAASPELLRNNMANLTGPRIINLPEYAAQDEDVKYAAVLNWLNQYKDWLLIFDNADTTEAAEKVEEVFAELQHGNVLITARIDNWSYQIKEKQLGVLDEKDAIAFLLETTSNSRTKKDNDPHMAAAIANNLGYLALALEQARAYIATQELSLADYHKRWEENSMAVLQWYSKHQMKYPASVAITWQTSFSQLSDAATTLLNRLSWLAPDPIPKILLEIAVPGVLPVDMMSAWAELKHYSLAVSSADKSSFTIHKLVQDVTRGKLDEITTLQTLQEALNWINVAFTGDMTNVNDWPYLEPFIPHLLILVACAQQNEINNPTSRLMNDLGSLFYTKAQYKLAEPLMRRALRIDEESFGSDHPNVGIRLNNLALLLKATNRLAEAEPLMRRALRIDEESFGSDHPNVGRDLNNLAQLLQATNRLAEAEPLMRRALRIDEESFGSDHPNVAIDLNNLALLLQATNRLAEAEPLMRRALRIDEESFGSDHPNVAIRLNNLAQLLQDTNRLAEAEPLMRRALRIDEESFGSDHPNVGRDLNNLAQLLKDTNRLAEAEPLMRRALSVFFQSLGISHPNTQTVGNNYMYLLREMGKSDEEIQDILNNLLQ